MNRLDGTSPKRARKAMADGPPKRRRILGIMPLEPRIMYDGAAAATTAAAASTQPHDAPAAPAPDAAHDSPAAPPDSSSVPTDHASALQAPAVGAPATDWITYYAESDGPRSTMLTYFGGTPWEKPEAYNRHSPRTGVANIRTPALLQVGALDINHNSEIYWSLTDRKIPVEYVVYPREGHGIAEPAHQRDLMERNLRWFTHWLK